MKVPRAFALGGIAGPLFFVTAVIVAAALRPEYSHYSQFMSELGETGGRSEGVMNFAGFLATGFLVFLCSLAFMSRFGATWIGALGSACVVAYGVGVFASGIFSCDLSCTPEVPTLDQRLHDIAGAIAFPAFVLAPLILGFRFRQLENWRSMFPYSLASSVVGLCAVIGLVLSVPERSGTGLFQRLVVGQSFLWLALVSWRLWASGRRSEAA